MFAPVLGGKGSIYMTRFKDVSSEYLEEQLQSSQEAVNFLETRNPELYNEYQERAQEMSEELEDRKPQSR